MAAGVVRVSKEKCKQNTNSHRHKHTDIGTTRSQAVVRFIPHEFGVPAIALCVKLEDVAHLNM
jgi:hypothetical protein